MNTKTFPKFISLLVVIFFSIGTVWGLLVPGTFSVHDSMHRAWIYEMSRNLTYFQFPPRWAPDLSWGYGYPYFHYFYPLPYYLGAFFYQIGFSLSDSFEIIQIIAIVGSAIAMYFYASQRSALAGLVASVVYVYAPYRAVNTYVRGALGESFIYLWVPLVMISIDKLCRRPHNRWPWILGIVSIAGILLSHNIGAIIFLPILFIYLLIKLWLIKPSQKIKILSIFFLGAGLSSYFWLPAFMDKNLIVQQPTYKIEDHFPFISQLIIPSWGYGVSVWGPGDGMSFQIGIANLIILAISLVFLFTCLRKPLKNSWQLYFFFGVYLFCLFMMNIRSLFIWHHLPLFSLLQFPWRFLSVIVLITPVLATFLIESISSRNFRIIFSALLISISVFFSYKYFQPDRFITISDSEIIDRYFPYDPRIQNFTSSQEYRNQQEEYLPLPLTVSSRPNEIASQFTTHNSQISITNHNPFDYQLEVTSPTADRMDVAIYDFPGWHVILNGQLIDHSYLSPHGNITFSLPQGHNKVAIKFAWSGWAKFANYLSLVTLFIIICLSSFPLFKITPGKKIKY